MSELNIVVKIKSITLKNPTLVIVTEIAGKEFVSTRFIEQVIYSNNIEDDFEKTD